MISTTFDLMRHGTPVGGRKYRGQIDDPLSAEGWAQMRAAVAGQCPWDVIISSPLLRCVEFARELAQRHDLALELDDRLVAFADASRPPPYDAYRSFSEGLDRYLAGDFARAIPPYLGDLWPPLGHGLGGILITAAIAAALGGINYLGVKPGAYTTDLLTIAKLVPLLVRHTCMPVVELYVNA